MHIFLNVFLEHFLYSLHNFQTFSWREQCYMDLLKTGQFPWGLFCWGPWEYFYLMRYPVTQLVSTWLPLVAFCAAVCKGWHCRWSAHRISPCGEPRHEAEGSDQQWRWDAAASPDLCSSWHRSPSPDKWNSKEKMLVW